MPICRDSSGWGVVIGECMRGTWVMLGIMLLKGEIVMIGVMILCWSGLNAFCVQSS